MKSKSLYKVPDGKLLKIHLSYDEKNLLIKSINIMGDFFAYPEEAIEFIENQLINTRLDREVLLKKISLIIKDKKIDFIGIDEESLTDGIMMCLK